MDEASGADAPTIAAAWNIASTEVTMALLTEMLRRHPQRGQIVASASKAVLTRLEETGNNAMFMAAHGAAETMFTNLRKQLGL
jgi:hypothetical protein